MEWTSPTPKKNFLIFHKFTHKNSLMQEQYRNFIQIHKTRMHSSRMPTGRSLSVSGGCTWSRGVYLVWGGVPGLGGCTWSGGCLPGTSPQGPDQVLPPPPPGPEQVHSPGVVENLLQKSQFTLFWDLVPTLTGRIRMWRLISGSPKDTISFSHVLH